MRSAVKISVHGEVEVLDLDAPEGELKVLQSAVGGWIEAVDLTDKLTMYVNEEGKLDAFPIINAVGNAYFAKVFGEGVDRIVGDVVFTGGLDEEGDTLGLTEEQVKVLKFVAS